MEQHFLTSQTKLEALVAAAGITPNDRVLELGAGGGTVAAALPPCRLTLAELEPRLARSLRERFPDAAVLQHDALEVLERLHADVILSNLPQALTSGVLKVLSRKTFKRALVAVHVQDDVEALSRLMGERYRLEPFLTLKETDFTPAQPFRSSVLRITPLSGRAAKTYTSRLRKLNG